MDSQKNVEVRSTYTERVSQIFGSLERLEDSYDLRVHGSNSVVAARHGARYAPGYVKNPEKWRRYDLKKDGTERMTGMSAHQQNKAAALEFMKTRTSSGSEGERKIAEDSTHGKLLFKKPKLAALKQSVVKVTDTHSCSNIEEKSKREHRKETSTTTQPSIHLSHLEDDT